LHEGWDELGEARAYREFGRRKSAWNRACAACDYLPLCAGDCLKHRGPNPLHDSRTLSSLCAGWKMFYAHALPSLQRVAEQMRAEGTTSAGKDREAGDHPAAPKVGRNDPCPCGSGKKFKKCCGMSR
jgi:uncharacterized protein